jgi:hypothetical protein
MEITTEHKTQIGEIISGMECPKDFKCYKSGFEDLSKAKVFQEGELIECLDVTSWSCELSFRFGMGHYCRCPLRKYIAQNFDR